MSEHTPLFFYPKNQQKCAQPNYGYYDVKGRSTRHYRVRFLYDEYRQACERAGQTPYAFSTFSKGLSRWRHENIERVVPTWFPGEYLQCFWAHLRIPGAQNPKRYLFVARLPYSEYTFIRLAEGVSYLNWIRSCIEAYRFFGGVPHVTEYDCPIRDRRGTESGSFKTEFPTLQAFASHYKTVLLEPHPKMEKSASKRSKPLVQRRTSDALGYVRKCLDVSPDFTTEELNEKVALLVDQFNNDRRGDKPSPKETFELYEVPQLLTLPAEDYDMSIWTERVVDSSYHFEYDRMRFSVPYMYACESVRIHAGEGFVEAYNAGLLIARHQIPSDRGSKRLFTDPAHRPPAHSYFADRLKRRFMELALDVGPATGAIMKETLSGVEKTGTSYRRCKELIDLQRMPSGVTLEKACSLVLELDMELTVESAMQIMRESTR